MSNFVDDDDASGYETDDFYRDTPFSRDNLAKSETHFSCASVNLSGGFDGILSEQFMIKHWIKFEQSLGELQQPTLNPPQELGANSAALRCSLCPD